MKRILLQPAYVLHRRAYRESSFLVELFTPEYGRLSVVARGMRKPRSSQGLIQPFIPLLISCVGGGELMTLTHVEPRNASAKRLLGESLFAGFYLNELLIYLLQKWDAHPTLYTVYEQTLFALQTNKLEQKILRSFEKVLLVELGYGIFPKSSAFSNTFVAEAFYRFIPEQGFVLTEANNLAIANLFSGKSLLAIAQEDWQDETHLQDAKRLMRLVLTSLLGKHTIYSRRLFIKLGDD